MKTAKLFLLVFSMFLLSKTNAQRLFFVFGHAEYASATGDLKNGNDNGLGVEAGVGIGMNKTFFIGTLGSTWLRAAKSNPWPLGTLRYTPVKVGIRRYIFRKNLFIKADAGLANMKYSRVDNGTSEFTYGAGAGFKFTGFEVIGDFTHVGNYGSWLSVKAGFTIGL